MVCVNSEFSITEDQEIMNLALNYNKMLWNSIASYMRGRVLEVGSGIGNFTEKIIELGEVDSITCFEIDKSCCKRFKENLGSNRNWSKVTLYEYDFNQSDLKDHFELIYSFNVLEHIKEDRTTVEMLVKYLKPGGWLFLYLPAMKCIYGSIDKELLHYRRYNKGMIRKLFTGLPIEIVNMKYCNMLGVVGWFYTNRILKRKSQSPSMVVFYDRYIFPLAYTIERFLPKIFGSNLFVSIKKK